MNKTLLFAAVSTVFVAGCASTGGSSMSTAELTECLQPNRRVVVEVGGRSLKPAPKPKPGAPEAKPGAPEAKPAKPAFINVQDSAYAQGNTAFDPGGALLKDGGKADLDKFVASLTKRGVNVGSIIISGHTDRLEAAQGNKGLSEQRAQAVKDYLATKGMDQKLMFWEGKDAREPVPVTKFCE